MMEKKDFIISAIRRKGFIESVLYGSAESMHKLMSAVKILILRVRGYDIDATVILKGSNFFFQSTKHAVQISKNCTIGKYTRISCGDNGRIIIGENVLIDDFVYIMAHEKIEIKRNTKIAAFTFITDFNHKFKDKTSSLRDQGYETKPVEIGENTWIGTHAVILPGVKIGNRAVIGAGSVVTKSIAQNAVAVGNPAKEINT